MDRSQQGAHAHLAGTRLGHLQVLDAEDLRRVAELVVDDSAHGSSMARMSNVLVQRWVYAPARNATQASLIRSAWPSVNVFMQESCV